MRLTFYAALYLVTAVAVANGYPQNASPTEDQLAAATDHHADSDDSDMYMEPLEPAAQTTNLQANIQDGYAGNSPQFYPSFAPFHNPPLGHSRPVYQQQEAAYSHRPTAYQQHVGYDTAARFSGYKGGESDGGGGGGVDTHGILGSGNFGVIRGGTFYGDGDDADATTGGGAFDQYNYFNGHGRPSFYFGGNPKPRPQYQQFENFRDFADINVPTNPAYSQYVVVYANRNGGKHEPTLTAPKNIMEHLALLDREAAEATTTTTPAPAPEKKLSKGKRKLAKLAPEKKAWSPKDKQASKIAATSPPTELYEPLLALS